METQKFEQWCMIELFGHNKIAGLVSEAPMAGGNFLRVDVPETKTDAAFTRFLSPGAIYAINPVTELVARTYAEGLRVKPIDAWDINAFMKKVEEKQLSLLTTQNLNSDFDDNDDR